jgi:hypothetical protein
MGTFDAASNCVRMGLVCVDHCLQASAAGDSSMGACACVVDQMVSMCETLAELAIVNSSYLPVMAGTLDALKTRNPARSPEQPSASPYQASG